MKRFISLLMGVVWMMFLYLNATPVMAKVLVPKPFLYGHELAHSYPADVVLFAPSNALKRPQTVVQLVSYDKVNTFLDKHIKRVFFFYRAKCPQVPPNENIWYSENYRKSKDTFLYRAKRLQVPPNENIWYGENYRKSKVLSFPNSSPSNTNGY